ncbi:hypothetical protein LXL04_005724 [Taraxacum kok-saghyz]
MWQQLFEIDTIYSDQASRQGMYPDPSLFGRTGYREKDGDGEEEQKGFDFKIIQFGFLRNPLLCFSAIDFCVRQSANEKVIVHENEADVAVAQDAGYETSLISRLALKPGKVSHNLINYTEVPGYKKLYRNGPCLIISQKWSLSD